MHDTSVYEKKANSTYHHCLPYAHTVGITLGTCVRFCVCRTWDHLPKTTNNENKKQNFYLSFMQMKPEFECETEKKKIGPTCYGIQFGANGLLACHWQCLCGSLSVVYDRIDIDQKHCRKSVRNLKHRRTQAHARVRASKHLHCTNHATINARNRISAACKKIFCRSYINDGKVHVHRVCLCDGAVCNSRRVAR